MYSYTFHVTRLGLIVVHTNERFGGGVRGGAFLLWPLHQPVVKTTYFTQIGNFSHYWLHAWIKAEMHACTHTCTHTAHTTHTHTHTHIVHTPCNLALLLWPAIIHEAVLQGNSSLDDSIVPHWGPCSEQLKGKLHQWVPLPSSIISLGGCVGRMSPYWCGTQWDSWGLVDLFFTRLVILFF